MKRRAVLATLYVADGCGGETGSPCKLFLRPSRLLPQASQPATKQLVNVHDVTFR